MSPRLPAKPRAMPIVNIKVAKGVTTEDKDKLIEGATELLERVLNKPASSTYVVIEEVDTDNFGVGGESLSVRRGLRER